MIRPATHCDSETCSHARRKRAQYATMWMRNRMRALDVARDKAAKWCELAMEWRDKALDAERRCVELQEQLDELRAERAA